MGIVRVPSGIITRTRLPLSDRCEAACETNCLISSPVRLFPEARFFSVVIFFGLKFRLKCFSFLKSDEFFLPIRQICHVGGDSRTISEFDGRIGSFTAADAVDPVCHVVWSGAVAGEHRAVRAISLFRIIMHLLFDSPLTVSVAPAMYSIVPSLPNIFCPS